MIFKVLKKCYRFSAFLAVLPFLVMAKLTQYVYVTELISLIPFRIGERIRYYFYKNSLASCGDDVVINFGTIISYPDTTIGNHVWIGTYNVFGRVDIGDFTLTAQGCHFLSGSHHHGIDDLNTPIMYQPGQAERIKIGPDIWVGANVTVMANIGHGCVIGAGSVVTKDIPPYSVAMGNPAHIIRSRK
jgi:Acetyltransferase (isoleucine patch superfamily)